MITANSVLVTVNVTANTSVSIEASGIIDTDIDFMSNTSLGNFTINVTQSSTTPVSTDLSSLYAASLKYVNTNASNKLNSSVLTWNLIKIYYTDAELNSTGIIEDSLSMYWYNTSSSQWVKLTNSSNQTLGTGVNTNENYVWVNSTFFSSYAIGGLKVNDQSCLVNAECYSNICCSGTCQSSCPTVATTIPSGGGGGGGGGVVSPANITVETDFTLSEDLIKILLKPGGIERKLVDISNTGKKDLTITVNLKNLENFLIFPGGLSEYTFDLDADETKSIQLNFFASEKQKPDIFPGKVVVTGDGLEKLITVIIEVESIEPLFDIDVEIPQKYKEVLPGEEVLVQLTIYNVKGIGRVDVYVEYGLKDLSGNIITSEHETLAVETQISIVESLDVPFDITPGNYVLYATVKYDDIIGTGTDVFRIVTEKEVEIPTRIVWSILLVIIILIVVYLLSVKFVEKEIKKLLKHIGRVKL